MPALAHPGRGHDEDVYLQAVAPRVDCAEHGVVVAHVRWARPGAKHTWLFEDACAWLAAHAAMSVLAVLLRIASRTVAAIVTRAVADRRDTNDLLAGLARTGIDEIAYRKGSGICMFCGIRAPQVCTSSAALTFRGFPCRGLGLWDRTGSPPSALGGRDASGCPLTNAGSELFRCLDLKLQPLDP
jgi:hypothetical protein